MSVWKPIYEVQSNGSVSFGSVKNLLNIARSACDLKVFDIYSDAYSTTIKCDMVSYIENSSNLEESTVMCGSFKEMSVVVTDSDTQPIFNFVPDIYHYYTIYNSNATLVASRWLDGEHKVPAGQPNITFSDVHTRWFAELDCLLFAEEEQQNVVGDSLET